MAVHPERPEATEKMVNYVDRETRIERPNVDSVGIDLRVHDEVISPRLFLPAANQASLALIWFQPPQRRGGHKEL
jgi:hypothetical protein